MKTQVMIVNAELLLLLITCVQIQGQTCDNGWFGEYPSCQYKCHCDNSVQCDNKGNCPGKCERGWFGPACQYADLVALNSTNTIPIWLYDNDDSTCNSDKTGQSVTIDLTSDFPITWIRLVIDKTDSWETSQVNLKFTPMSGSGTVACTNQKQFVPTNQILDIYCELQETVEQVIVEGSGVQFLCSVYISGGRNVALKQNTTQSSTIYSRNSYYAVDGNTNRNFEYCTHTDNNIYEKPYWTVTFTSAVQINRYVLYNRRDCCPQRLGGFTLTSFNGNKQIFSYTDPNKVIQDVYTVTSAIQTSVIDRVRVQTVYTDRNLNISVVTLCEAEMYGESFCTIPNYGRNCENPCNCYNNEKCFVSTGGCPNGCAEGFYGETCRQDCQEGFYGINCRNLCSANCQNKKCNKINGNCLGCINGKTGPMCSEACPSGCTGSCDQNTGDCLKDKTYYSNARATFEDDSFRCRELSAFKNCNWDKSLNDCPIDFYGRSCSLTCNENCGGDGSCDRNTGDCSDGCDDGYIGNKCQYPCATGKYGHNCSLSCSSGCLHTNNVTNSTLCHHDTGYCVDGCLEHYSGDRCEINEKTQKTDPEKPPPVAAIVAPIVTALVIAVLIVLSVILWRRRQHRKASTTNIRFTQNNSRCQCDREFAGVEVSRKTAEEDKVYESFSDNEDTQNTMKSVPAKTVDEKKDPKLSIKPEPSDKWKQFQLPVTRHDTEKLQNKGSPYYNTLDGLSETGTDGLKLDSFTDSHKNKCFQSQFNEVPTSIQATVAIAQSPEHNMKSHYKNICAHDGYAKPSDTVVTNIGHPVKSKSQNMEDVDHYEQVLVEKRNSAVRNTQLHVDSQAPELDDSDPYEQVIDNGIIQNRELSRQDENGRVTEDTSKSSYYNMI